MFFRRRYRWIRGKLGGFHVEEHKVDWAHVAFVVVLVSIACAGLVMSYVDQHRGDQVIITGTAYAQSSEWATVEAWAAGPSTKTPRPTKTPKPTKTAKPTKTPKDTATPRPTRTPKARATSKPPAEAKPTKTPRATPTSKPTSTPKPTKTPKPTRTPTPDMAYPCDVARKLTWVLVNEYPDVLREIEYKYPGILP